MLELSFLPPDYVINVTREVDSAIESDFLIRAVRVRNASTSPARITRIWFDVMVQGKTVRQMAYPETMMDRVAQTLAQNLEHLGGEVAQVFLGTEGFWDREHLSRSATLQPGEETGLLLEHFRTLQRSPVDECVVSVFYTDNGHERTAACGVPVSRYTCKSQFMFPLKGTWLAVNNYDSIHFHRRMHSQEFAMDLIQPITDQPVAEMRNEEYACHGKEILAVADGEVMDCFNEMPENPAGLGSRLPEAEWNELKKRHGFVAGVAGNYAVLKHGGDEFTFYAHMIPGSLRIAKGAAVKQGQVIGLLGNSGNSDAPHLHFQLMAGPSILTARGLPCSFMNLKCWGQKIAFIEENNSIVVAT